MADAINYFLAHDRPRAEALAAAMRTHFERLATVGLDIHAPVVRMRGGMLAVSLLLKALALAVGLLPALLGTLHHLAPFLIVRGIAGRVQVPGKTTITQARLGLGLPIYGAWYALVWWWIDGHFSQRLAWGWTLAMPFAGTFALSYWRQARETGRAWWQEIRMLFRGADLEELRASQRALWEKLHALAEEYRRIQVF